MVNNREVSQEKLHETAIEWAISETPVGYENAVGFMEARAQAIAEGSARQMVWLLEHPPLYTSGTSAKPHDLSPLVAFPVHKSGRGGQFTYHGPGQRVAYLMLDLRPRGRDVRDFVRSVEAWLIDALTSFNVKAGVRCGRVGVWVDRTVPHGPLLDDKIAAIGLRVRKWVSFHGISLNVEPDLSHFDAIVPCGISEPGLGVTSLVDLGLPLSMSDVDIALRASFERAFGDTMLVDAPSFIAREP